MRTKYKLDSNSIQRRLSKMRKKKYSRNVGVMFDEETYQKLVSITDEKEVTISEFIRGIVQDNLNEKSKGELTMNNTANRENESAKKMFDHIQKKGPSALLKKIRIDGSNIVLIENKWNERDDRKSVKCNFVKEIENETAGLYINIKHGQPTTDQVFDAVYGRGAKCKIRVIIFDGKVSEANCCNPAANEYVVDSLITAMIGYPLNLHLVKLMSDDSEDDQNDMEGFAEPTPEYTMQELPSPEEFRHC